MGYKNRKQELLKYENNRKGWQLLVNTSIELDNILQNNKIFNKIHILNIISQMNGKFNTELNNKKLLKNKKYNRVWEHNLNSMYNILNKKEINYRLLSNCSKQLVYVGKLNYNKNL